MRMEWYNKDTHIVEEELVIACHFGILNGGQPNMKMKNGLADKMVMLSPGHMRKSPARRGYLEPEI